MNEAKPDHFYLAQVASELACLPFLVWGKSPPAGLRDLNTWMLKFGNPDEIKKKSEQTAEERMKQDAEYSKSHWLNYLGVELDENGKLRPTKPLVTRPAPNGPIQQSAASADPVDLGDSFAGFASVETPEIVILPSSGSPASSPPVQEIQPQPGARFLRKKRGH